MLHTLVIPEDLKQKLSESHGDEASHRKWSEIGVDTVEDMLERIKDRLNEYNPKLEISNIRIEDNAKIKERINNSGQVSMFAGYFENDEGITDALFFYTAPKAGNANDFLASKIPPVVIGIYKNNSKSRDLHINNMPVYVVGVCTSSRVTQASVKQQFICCDILGWHYIDIFNNDIYDILNANKDGDITEIISLKQFDSLLSSDDKDWFQVDDLTKTLIINCEKMLGKKNDTAYIYRWFLEVVPAVYLAANEGYAIDVSTIKDITTGVIPLIRDYIEKFPSTILK